MIPFLYNAFDTIRPCFVVKHPLQSGDHKKLFSSLTNGRSHFLYLLPECTPPIASSLRSRNLGDYLEDFGANGSLNNGIRVVLVEGN